MDDLESPAGGGDFSRTSIDALLDDQSGCWRRGERTPAEAFLERRAEPDTEAALDLIYHEILLRSRRGEDPDPEEYVRRFPQFREQLRAHFEVHEFIGSGASPLNTAVDHETDGADGGRRPGGELPAVTGYEILAELGRGGNGVVYHARGTGLKRMTALKVLRGGALANPREAARLRGEALALARIGHPNIIQIYEFGETGGRPYLALEFAPGGTLEARLRGAPQPARAAAELVETLARAVHAAHRAGVIHRDLKPANVLFAADGTPKIADFGLAKRLNAEDAQTRTGDILGTPYYMAPEQVHGTAVGPATDVYALGAILYELLTGLPPFRGTTVWGTLAQVIGRDPVPPRQLVPSAPRDLETICLKCLHKDPAHRYGGAAELADDLGRFLARRPVRARPAPTWERVWKWAQRRPGTAAGLVTALVVTVGMAAAHEVDLRQRLACAEREAAVADVNRMLSDVQGHVNAGHWQEASDQLHEQVAARLSAARAAFPGDDRLGELAGAADRLQKQIDSRLTDAARLRRFRALRRDVGFDATPFNGSNSADRLRQTRASVSEALRLFDLAPGRGTSGLDASHLTAEEKREVREGCCELLLELSDAEAAVADGGARAADVLDFAAQLGVETPLIEARRPERPVTGPPALTRGFEWFLRGNDLCRAGRVADARNAYCEALAVHPEHFGARYALGVCYLKDRAGADVRRAHLLLAREHFTHCIQTHSERVWLYLQRAMAEDELGDAAAAEADYDQVERKLRDAPDPTALYALHVNRGVGRIKRRDPAGAVPDLTRAAELKPGELPAYFDLAKACQDLARTDRGQLLKAREYLDQAVGIARPAALADVFRGRAKINEELNDWKAAVSDLEQAVRHEPAGASSPGAATDLRRQGQLLLKCDKAEDALRAADARSRRRPTTPRRTGSGSAAALLRLDRYSDAIAALDRHVVDGERKAGRRPEARVYRARAQAAVAVGDYAAAAEDYGRGAGRRRPGERGRGPRRARVVPRDAGNLAAGAARLRAGGAARSREQ
ncbi:serine/threonine-protein kinase [Frigoriglobus tundricola]|uniref:serine/threonine-protein kinase n=1 Tax=Frigoriglobus tundricola TaxID=2774151 RepID=UPI001D08CD66|nr:serine/threonine-protein kinase [Frigoriglobus tundricola]